MFYNYQIYVPDVFVSNHLWRATVYTQKIVPDAWGGLVEYWNNFYFTHAMIYNTKAMICQ